MAGSRVEKLGTVFSRVQGLLRSGAMKPNEKPIWYDVYAAFPPRIEPKFDRFIQEQEPINILYREDAIRAKFYNTFGNPDVIDMRKTSSVCFSEKFIQKYRELESQAGIQSESQLFDSAKEALRSEGITLKTLAEIEQEKKTFSKSKEARSKQADQEDLAKIDVRQLRKLTEEQETKDFVYDEILDPELKQK